MGWGGARPGSRRSQASYAGLVVIAGVHLKSSVGKGREELLNLIAYLRPYHRDDEWVIAGDFNWPDSEPFLEFDGIR
jgi:endonuclease/exonuclease/phosphatase family metal-dependent hydrolase